MKKKILSIFLMVMAVTMILAVSAWAEDTPSTPGGDQTGGDPAPAEQKIKISASESSVYATKSITLTATVTGIENPNILWNCDSSAVTITGNGTTATLTANNVSTETTVTVYAYCNGLSDDVEITIKPRTLTVSVTADSNYTTRKYYVGGSVPTSGLIVKYMYSDETTGKTTTSGFTVEPATFDKSGSVNIYAVYNNVRSSNYVTVTVDSVSINSVRITSPSSSNTYTEGDTLSVSVEVANNDGSTTVVSGGSLLECFIGGTKVSNGYTLKKSDNGKTLTVKYDGISSANSVTLSVKEKETKKPVSLTITETTSAKKTYYVGDKFDLSGYKCVVTFNDGSTTELTPTQKSSISFAPFTSTGTQSVTVKYTSNNETVSATVSVKVVEKLTFYGLIDEDDKDEDDAYILSSKINIKVGDKLNKTVDWTDVFDEVYLEYKDSNGKRKTERIRKDSDLEDILPGAKLLLGVYSKRNDYDKYPLEEITAKSFNSDGELELILYVEYAGEKFTDSDEAIVVTVSAESSGVIVNLYRSSYSSSYDSVTFDNLEDAFEALEDEEYDDFSSTVRSSDYFVIKIFEDQRLGASFDFEPETDNKITLDLNGYELSIPSDFIEWNRDNEDMVLTVTNTNSKKDGKLTYRDLNVSSITVEKGDKLEFKKDVIPGFYTIKVENGSNGTVEVRLDGTKVSDPTKAFSAPKNGKLTFTITPDKNYEIETVKANSSSVTSSSDYTLNKTTGVGTYEVKALKDLTLSVTFKKSSSSSSTTKDDSSAGKTSAVDNWTNPFSDVTSRDAYYDSVAFVCYNGIFNGTSSSKFSPTMSMTRAMFVTAVGRLAEKSQGIDIKNNSAYQTSSFTDVSKTDAEISYAVPYIEWASRNGITQGVGNGKFDPKTPITHAQMYTFMYRYAMFVENLNPSVSNTRITVSDKSDIPTWAEDAVKFATQSSLIISSGGRITPNDNALRWELATIIGGFAQKVLNW